MKKVIRKEKINQCIFYNLESISDIFYHLRFTLYKFGESEYTPTILELLEIITTDDVKFLLNDDYNGNGAISWIIKNDIRIKCEFTI